MAEKTYEYEMVEGFISKYPGNDEIIFENARLRRNEIFRGLAKNWRGFSDDGFIEFLKENNVSPETEIAIAKDIDSFAVIQLIKF